VRYFTVNLFSEKRIFTFITTCSARNWNTLKEFEIFLCGFRAKSFQDSFNRRNPTEKRLKLNYLYFYSQKFRDYADRQVVVGICITRRKLKFVFLESFTISRPLINYLTIAAVIAVAV